MNARIRLGSGVVIAACTALLAVTWVAGSSPAASSVTPTRLAPMEAPSAFGQMLMEELEGGAPSASPAAVPGGDAFGVLAAVPGVDGLVNDPTDDTPESTTQSETTIAVFDETLCAGYNNSGPGGLSGLSRSPDLGETWDDRGGIGGRGDPVLAVDEGTGVFYYAEIATIGGNPAIGVARSTNDCLSFGAPADAAAATSGNPATTLSDKPWIAVDNSGGANDGNLYVCWTRFIDTSNPLDGQADTSELRVSRSTDGGLTFTNEQVVSPQGTAPFGCSIGVDGSGAVHLVWADRAGAAQDDIRYSTSGDAGVNYSAPVSIATGNVHPGNDTIVNCGGGNRPTLTGNIRMLHQAWLAVDTTGGPFDGNLYVVWASDPAGTPDNSDVFFSRSTNGGANWGGAVQVGGGGGATDQFEPFVTVGGAGAVSIVWYDRRNDQANNMQIDVYKTFSQDGGATLDPIVRVTDQSFGVPQLNPNFDGGIAACYMGEYIAATGDAHNFYYAWGDNRNTVTSVAWPAGRPDPDVFFELEEAPIVNDADLSVTKDDTPDPVVAGTNLTYDLEVTNDGPDIALDVVVTDTLPSGVTFVSTTLPGGCDATAAPVLTCELGDLANGDTVSFSITVAVSASLVFDAGGPTTITNTASVAGAANDPDPSNNTDAEDTLVVAEADLAIVSAAIVDPPAEILVGDNVQLTLRKTVTNLGPSAPMNATLTATASASAGATVVPAVAVTAVNALGLNEQRVVDEVFTVSCQQESQHTFTFSNVIAPANAADTDPNPANNTGNVQVVIECVVPVKINIKPGSDPNSINLNGGTSVTVAVLKTAAGEYGLPLAFDPAGIVQATVRFGPPDEVFAGTGGAAPRDDKVRFEDSLELDESTRDGDLDRLFQFRADQTGLGLGDTIACLKGDWVDGGGVTHSFFGCDSVRIVRE